jgi:hypothetical protein
MKRICIFLLAAIMVGGLAWSAQAVTTVLDPSNGEMHLNQIVANSAFGSVTGYATSQAFANAFLIVQTLPAFMSVEVTAYARFADFTQDPGMYNAGNKNTGFFFSSLSPPVSLGKGIFTSPDVKFVSGATPIGFKDNINAGQYTLFSEVALNQGSLANGLIFKISDTHYIVAFEDGAGAGKLGDKDYNDLVLNVVTSPVPIPGSVLLLGSGLLGLVGLGWRKRAKRN